MNTTQLSFKEWSVINKDSFKYIKCPECGGTGHCPCCEDGQCVDCNGKGKFLVDIKTSIPTEALYKSQHKADEKAVAIYG